MSGHPVLTMLTVTVAGMAPALAQAQTEVAVELGASQVGPPSGADGESARFGIGGLRASHYSLSGSGVSASLMFGRAFGDADGGDFWSGLLSGTVRDRWGPDWGGGLNIQLVGFEVRAPFPYRALAVEGGPSVSFQSGPVTFTAAGVGGFGRSRVQLWRRVDGPRRTFEDELWRIGGTGELLLGPATFRAGVVGGVHDTPGGTYTSGGGRVILSGGWGATELRADVWETPLGTEFTGGLAFAIPLAGWSVRGFLGKSEPDPLTLAEPGSGSGGILLGKSLYTSEVALAVGDEPYEILSETSSGARVRIEVEALEGAVTVAVLGDFTLWDEVSMRNEGARWVVDLEIEEGTHHYGFVVDDEWYVPDDTRDVVPDEWGRLSAILVIEGAN